MNIVETNNVVLLTKLLLMPVEERDRFVSTDLMGTG